MGVVLQTSLRALHSPTENGIHPQSITASFPNAELQVWQEQRTDTSGTLELRDGRRLFKQLPCSSGDTE